MKLLTSLFAISLTTTVIAKEYHVGSNQPLKTISAAAELAQPGDVITVHEGVYRERVNPPRGGESDSKRITYQAAPGEKVVITGSEVIKGWEKVGSDTWKVTIPNTFFGAFNPYSDVLRGDWYGSKKRVNHTGAVYRNGHWLTEAVSQDAVLKPAGKNPLWFGQVDKDTTTIWAQFPGMNPNEQPVEINVRQTVFYPEKEGINYITVRGFTLERAATPWAPPTAEQKAVIGTHWSKGWIIENNIIRYSICSGLSLGKHGDEYDNKSQGTAEGYVKTIERALKHGWNKETIGGHIVRNNEISHCEQTGIVGSMGCAFSTVTDNVIHDIHVRGLFSGAEMAGLKFHGAIDTVIARNHIYRCYQGMWLDWMTQGTRVTGNLFHNNRMRDLYVEVNHGPFVVDNNLFLSPVSINDRSSGGAYVHNLITGSISIKDGARVTPYHHAHSTAIAGMRNNPSGDNRYYNNIFTRHGSLSIYNPATLPGWMAGNVFLKGSKPCKHEESPLLKPDFDPGIKLVEKPDGWHLELTLDKAWAKEQKRSLVTTALLGKAKMPNLPYENADGTPLQVDTDYSGAKRDTGNPFPGPFEIPKSGTQTLKVWPKQ